MIPINPALIIAGPCLIQRRGRTFYSKGNVVVTPQIETFQVDAARFGTVEQRESNLTLQVQFTPAGVLDNVLDELWPYGAIVPGRFVHNSKTVSNVDTTDDELDITAHGFEAGAAARLASYGTLPSGTAAATLYYLGAPSADAISLHASRAAAIAGTSKTNMTDAGSGTHRVIEQEPLVVWSFQDNKKFTFHNSALTGVPDLNTGATVTPIGQATYTCYRKFATDPTDAAAFYTESTEAITDTSFDPADIITEAYALAWGSAAPWSSMSTRDGARISFPLDITPVFDDAGGILTHQITGHRVECRARPNNVSESEVFTKRLMQGSGAGRGRRISGDNLDITGSELFVRIYGADLRESPINYDAQEQRVGELLWVGNRTFSAGAPDPIYLVAAAAPSS
jgi:hypothetical protein